MMSQAGILWQQMTEADLTSVDLIGNEIHIELPERPQVFQEKFKLFPPGCKILCSKKRIVGYGISHPWILNNIPPLDTFLDALPESPNCLFIHDVVVLPEARGHNATAIYVTEMREVAVEFKLKTLALVSVYDTTPLWARFGFKIVTTAALELKLASYGNTAKYMICNIND